MRVLYIDIDSLRPDHLGCYGYGRATSPHIDALARESVRFEGCYISDAPCLPSRTALWSGRCGFHTGVVGHGGTTAQPFIEGPSRGFADRFRETGWMGALRRAGLYTAAISPFGERHSAWHWYAGFNEVHNTGKRGQETAAEINAVALSWLARHASQDNWFLHVNYWDPHTPYRTPADFGEPFADAPLPAWPNEEVRQRGWDGFGPHSPQEPTGFAVAPSKYPRQPTQLDSPEALRRWLDSYDTGIRYADEAVGQLLTALADTGVLGETAIIVSSDHGENQGELNVWGDHQTADEPTCRIPLIIRWPGLPGGRVDRALHYHFDWAATLIELLGGNVPDGWDGQSFATAFRDGREAGRPYVVTSQGAWACQRGVRFDEYLCLRSYHDGYKQVEPVMLFDLATDPHEERDLAAERPAVVEHALVLLAEWLDAMAATSAVAVDPLRTVMLEGGPFHCRGRLPAYLERLRATGRAAHAERLAARHPTEA